ncbi:hypothetical protein ACIQI8_11935 [Streptomyces sp. NPDC092369]|uniref:hypothetical protein n=1 Tax=Streptomyces sp. NPDC092369 TaxID=3366015 RepID=UPI003814FD95
MNTERPDDDTPASGGEVGASGTEAAKGAETEAAENAEVAAKAAGTEESPVEASGAEETPVEAAGVEETGARDDEDTESEAAPGAEAGDAETAEAPADAHAPVLDEAPDAPDVDEADPDPVPAEVPGPHESEAEAPRPNRRRPRVLVASVAAAVLLVGGGGAYLAATASGGDGGDKGAGASGGDGGTPPQLVLDGYAEGGSNGIAPGEPNPYGVTYKVDGSLPDGPDSAPVYRATGEVTKDEVARLAKALGVDGSPVVRGQSWQVGPDKDGAGPSLVVDKAAPGTWTFHRFAAGTDNCKSMTVCPQDPANPAGDTVSEAAAKKAAAPILKAIGQDDAKVDASQVMGAQRAVNAEPTVGGLPTYGWTTGLTVSAQGEVVGGTGRLKAPVKGDTYPVLSAKKTLALMNAAPTTDHRMGIGGCASAVPQKDRLEAPCGSSTAQPTRETMTIGDAVFGLAARSVDGRQALVPSWLFQVRSAGAADGFRVTYPAVDPKYLASPSTTPTGAPTPTASTPGGDEPTSAPQSRDVEVQGYSAEGKELTVTFTGGVCADYKATASESGGEVTATVTEKPWKNKVCIMIAKEYQQTVQLDAPLGDREVVGSDGKGIPLEKAGARLPQASMAR